MKEIDENGTSSGKNYHTAIQSVVKYLKSKRTELEKEIYCDEEQRASVMGQMSTLEDKLSVLNANLKKKSEFRKEYDKAIAQTESNFFELVEKSESFLSLTRRQVLALNTLSGNESKRNSEDYNGNENGIFSEICNEDTNRAQPLSPESCPQRPAAVLAITSAGNQGNCYNCAKEAPCTTIMIPYRANGL